MKKLFAVATALLLTLSSFADEGMWLLPYLQKMNIKDMQAKGCKLTAEQIYSLNQQALKDAIVIFGGGCTGEIVSPEGLIFTNHHCGYGAIQALSTVDHDYLKNGYWARNNSEELSAPGLSVKFIRKIVDVTPDILGNVPSISHHKEREKIVADNIEHLKKEYAKSNSHNVVTILPFFGGNQFFLFEMEVFTDIRLVGTPPSSIGKFGGETDNWMWPRHTGDFSIFRVYANADNQPADYSPSNRPYEAASHLSISLKGFEEGDFAMIMGFPGSTERYMTSYEIDQNLEYTFPQRVFIRGERQAILAEDMRASDKVRIQYASKYAGSSNYWKNAMGMSEALVKLDVKSIKQVQEQSFQQWAEKNTLPEERYIDALSMIEGAVEGMQDIQASSQYLAESVLSVIEITKPAAMVARANAKKFRGDKLDEMNTQLHGFYKDFNTSTDKKVAARMLTILRENAKYTPDIFEKVIDANFGGDIAAYVDHLYANSHFATEEQALAFVKKFKAKELETDPALELYNSAITLYRSLYEQMAPFAEQLAEGQRLYIAGLMLQQPDKAWASDANFTIRLTYGNVLPYSPKDGVTYNYYTTLKGVMEKKSTTNPEFTVEPRLEEIYNTKDYGRYANSKGEMPVAFLSNLDITGGNSGSPIMNGNGELIGLAFDGNWEALSGDIAFDPELQRTISVDVRYVLMIIDKFAGAGWLLDEMTLVE